ncbi:uncharacterized protein LOC141623546 [Silene latifolia]|uniref:uncharacterized protein LOC141623546 n=1 Tax=Silene latifolia TaxID=37657 RepID=UPI003D7801BA
MSLPLGKLTILIGAGVVGSILAKEGRMPSVSDVFSGALKIALKPLKQSDSKPTTSKPRNDALITQVNSLRQELQLLASSRPVTIVTSRGTGGSRVGVIIVIVVLGYGYVWWKGWKLPNFMFATKRGLKDACNSVSAELDKVFRSVKLTRKKLSSTLDESSCKYDEIVASTLITKDEVTDVCGKVSKFSVDVQAVHNQIRTLETKMGKIQTKQDVTKEGVARLLLCTLDADNKLNDLIQDPSCSASRPALEHTRVAVCSRSMSLPTALPLELPSPPASDGSCEEYRGVMGAAENGDSASVSNGECVSETTEILAIPDQTRSQPARSPGFLSRTISATLNFKF